MEPAQNEMKAELFRVLVIYSFFFVMVCKEFQKEGYHFVAFKTINYVLIFFIEDGE